VVYARVTEGCDSLEEQGLVCISKKARYRVYSLSPEGFRRGISRLNELDVPARSYVKQVAAWVRGLSFQQLVAAVYSRYPDMKVNSVFR
jgi:hypothetical protein